VEQRNRVKLKGEAHLKEREQRLAEQRNGNNGTSAMRNFELHTH
jgi:hypothetical protein